MTVKGISGIIITGLCIAVIITAGLPANAAAQGYYYPYSNSAPQTPQEREELFKAFQNMDKNKTSQATPIWVNPYYALQNPYANNDPQAALEQANALKAIQKLNGFYQDSLSGDNWYYWASMWLNSPTAASSGATSAYSALQNPYSFQGPQAALDQADAYKEIQKWNKAYQNPLDPDNWYYWTNMWLSLP